MLNIIELIIIVYAILNLLCIGKMLIFGGEFWFGFKDGLDYTIMFLPSILIMFIIYKIKKIKED